MRSLAILLFCSLGAVAQATLITNGSFESGPNPGAVTELPVGSTALPGWTVVNGAIDYVGTAWQDAATDGARALELHGGSGASAGGVAQTFATTPGSTYQVTFQLAGDPLSSEAYDLRVQAAGASADFDFQLFGANAFFLGWQEETWEFTANALSTTLEFTSLGAADATGPALDNVAVSLVTVPEPEGAASGACLLALISSFWPRRRTANRCAVRRSSH